MAKKRKHFLKIKRQEEFYKKSKKIKVRARSYFKIKFIDEKYRVVSNCQRIIDLGCSPGSWIEYLEEVVDEKCEIVGVDRVEVLNVHKFSSKVKIIHRDFRELDVENVGEFDCVLSDMAPNFSGNLVLDKGLTYELNMLTLKFCETHLRRGGNSVIKTFVGGEVDIVRDEAKKLFKKVVEVKPKSSKKKSSEMFLVCLKKR